MDQKASQRPMKVFSRAEEIGLLQNPDLQLLREIVKYDSGIEGEIEDPAELDTDVETLLTELNAEFRALSYTEERGSGKSLKSDEFANKELSKSEIQTGLSVLYYLLYDLFRYHSSKYEPGDDNYVKLAEIINPDSDFIVSMNYDMLLERALHHTGKDFTYHIGDKEEEEGGDPVSLLKPHGSINLKAEIGTSLQMPFVNIASLIHSNTYPGRSVETTPFLELKNNWYRNLTDGETSYLPVIMPPISDDKDYKMSHIYNQSWDRCEKRLKNVSEVVVIGCSLREEDEKLLNVLDKGLSPDSKITIYTGSDSGNIANRVGRQTEDVRCEAAGSCPYFGDFIKDRY